MAGNPCPNCGLTNHNHKPDCPKLKKPTRHKGADPVTRSVRNPRKGK